MSIALDDGDLGD